LSCKGERKPSAPMNPNMVEQKNQGDKKFFFGEHYSGGKWGGEGEKTEKYEGMA